MHATPGRWYHRVLPVTALLVGAVGLAALLVPGVRTQLALSATHRPEPYVELSVARTSTGLRDLCRGTVVFDIASHLSGRQRLDYLVTVAGPRPVTRAGHVVLDRGESARISRRVPRPPGRSLVTVDLPGRDQRLQVHCPSAPRSRS